MRDNWTFEDLERLTGEALHAADQDLLARIWASDAFVPSLGYEGGLGELINDTPEKKAAECVRVKALYVERAAIKAQWAKDMT